MRRIAIANLKGGTAKTATATALAVGLARRGRRVLVVDCDGQANASFVLLGGRAAEGPTLADVLTRRADAEDAIRETTTPGVELLPAASSLSGVNVALVQELGRDTRLRSALGPLDGRWDFVVLDTSPTVTTVLANVLVYASEVLVPVDPGVFALLGLVELERLIAEVRDAYGNQELRLSGLLLCKVARSNVARDVEAELRSRFGALVYEVTIPVSAKIEESFTRGQTVFEHAPKGAAAVAYGGLVTEVLGDG